MPLSLLEDIHWFTKRLRCSRLWQIRMEVASSRPDHLPTLSAAKASKLSMLVKSPFPSGAADAGNATPTFCFGVPAISKLTTLTVESLWTAPAETAKHHILAIDEAPDMCRQIGSQVFHWEVHPKGGNYDVV